MPRFLTGCSSGRNGACVYGFRAVHQMISTVSATLRDGMTWADALRNAFLMGSMTGAPKIRAMELIDELESSRRGVYSGAIGYVTPAGDFDFSVVIRSLLYNADSRYASFSVGSAITYDADPAAEWAECRLKAQTIRDVLTDTLQRTLRPGEVFPKKIQIIRAFACFLRRFSLVLHPNYKRHPSASLFPLSFYTLRWV